MAANLSPCKCALESSEPENWFTSIKPPHTRAFAEQDYDLVSERNSILFFCPDYTASPHQSFGLKDRSLPSLTLRQGMADPISSHISQIYKSECQHGNRDVLLDLCQSCREQDGSRTCQKLHLDPSIPFRQPSPNPQRPLTLKPCSVVLPKLRIGLSNNPVAKPPREGNVQIEIQSSDSEHGNETDMHGNGTGRHGNGTNKHGNETDRCGNEMGRHGNGVGRHENEPNQNENRELKSDADVNESLDLFSNEPETNEPIIDETKQNENETMQNENETMQNENETMQNENETIQTENEIRWNETIWSDDEDDSGLPDTFPCVSCHKQINWKEERVHTHKILNVLTCLNCFQTFNTGVFEVDEEGSEIYCTLCGDGGELFVCDNDCPKSFCQTCILNVCGSEAVEKLKSPDSNWICFVCDPSPLKKDTDFCKHVVETLRSRKKKRRQLERRLKIEKSEKNKVYKSKEFISDSDESEHESMDIGTGRKNENQSGENENQSGKNENQSGKNENQSGGNENQSGGNQNQSGGNDQSRENENKSGGNENQSGENENQSGNSENESVKNGNESEKNEIEETDVHVKEEPPVSTDNDGFYMESKEDLDPVEDGLSSSDDDSNECNLNIPFLFNYTDSTIDDTGEGSGINKKVRRGSGKPIVKKRKLSLSTKKKLGVKNKVDAGDSSVILSDNDYLLDSPTSENPSGETQSKKPADKRLAPLTKTGSPSVDKTKKPRHEFKVKKSDYGIESSKRGKGLSSSSGSEKEEKDEVKSPPANVVVIDSSNDEAGDPTPSNLSRNRSKKSRLSSLSSSESKTSRKAKLGDKKVRSKKRIEDISSSDDGSDNNAFVVPCSLSSSSSSPLLKDKDRTVLTIDSDGSSDSLGSKVVQKKKKRKLYFSDEDSSSSSSKRKRKVVVLDSSNEEFEDSEGSGYYFKGKHKKRKSLHARISSSDDSDDDDDEVGGVRRKETTPTNKSSNDEEASTSTTPVKTKKIRKLISKDKLAFETKEAQKAEKERLERLKKKSTSQTVQDKRLILEKDAETSEVLLEVRSSLVSRILPHQAKGIKFLYNCVCEDLKRLRSEPGSGAILAHCMGLGKTFQVISFIDCLLSNSESTNVDRVIVLCPVNTLLNWNDEWNKWISLSRRDYRVSVVDAKLNNQRLMIIERWFKCGGVALMGYEMFRNLASGSKIRKAKLRESFSKYLLDPGPDIIICDEGHVLRRESSNLSLVVSRVATRRRIVLTGTPLQNNLKEYYTMVNFVKPNLLGTMKEFCNQFANPIANGQCADSSPYQVRVMKYRAHVLFQTLSGCVDRKDYRILAESLPPKYEYVVSVRMTPVQSQLISRYLGRTFHTASDLFSTFASLAKVWSHPWVLMLDQERKRLKDGTDSLDGFINDNEGELDDSSSLEGFIVESDDSDGEYKVKKKKNPSTSSSSRETSKAPSKDCPTPPVVSKESTPSSWFEDLLSDEAEDDIDSSGKILFLLELLEETKKVHEKVLVFSQSLLLLDQIEYLLQQRDFMEGIDYFRLDGSTKASHRTELMKKFNRKNNESIRLFLISTKAGSLGVNLIGANRVVVFDACWNPTHDLQSVFRTYRFGQTKPVFVYRLLAQGTMEEKIYDRQVTKTSLSLRVIDEKQVGRHYTNNQLHELFTFTPAPPPEEDGAYDRPTNDIVFCKILDKLQPKVVIKYHEHDSLLEHIFDEELSEEERKAAWDNYNAAKELESRAYNIGMHVQNDGSFVAPLNSLSGQNPAIPATDLAKVAFQRVTQGLTISAHIMNAINLRNLLAPKVQNPKDFATIQRYVMTCDKIQIHLQSLQSLIPEIRDNLSNNTLRSQLPSNERSLLDSQRMAFLAKLKDIDEAVQVPTPDHNHLRRLLPMFVGQLHSQH